MAKKILKYAVTAVLGWQVRRLRQKNSFTVIGVVGSYGKTSTKLAIAEVLEHTHNVRYQKGNYNDIVSVPLIFFGLELPSLFNPLAWLLTFIKIEQQLRHPFPCDVVVVELGTDGPGQISQFKKYLYLDIGVVTSIGPEHMQYFDSLEAVAKEELAVRKFSKKLIVNGDLCAPGYLKRIRTEDIYKVHLSQKRPITDWQIKLGDKNYRVKSSVISEAQVFSRTSAFLVGILVGEPADKLEIRLGSVHSAPGRLQLLKGHKLSTIIDDTYNASPEATKIALDTLYSFPAKQRIALLGMMNELGDDSVRHHRSVGRYCDPEKIDYVITLGKDANTYIAHEAEKRGCKVYRANNPKDAGEYIISVLSRDAVILAKGSQNGVFAEEAVKLLLANPDHARKLVRQSSEWRTKKRKLNLV